ncbi:pyridoxamine 5'-phosphate oxidase family protein [Jannaschia formosa]|uniref:pyridoxamine 5'-phosphate oxidase family protein n=1 Tax=Jannaschia formosa TaxID=2259592 RepID=UPI000E1C3699|nr:pyridoxamine 5'-phosphate oxidase family protein [Jannaschia formosa]TFL17755.1 pyridoxamine 5'-phosphate oxidase family protein [Jannaschia formosa]
MAHDVTDLDALHALYGAPGAPALDKVADRLTPLYRRWVMASRFCILSTVGPEGTDASPRGDDGPVVQAPDDRTLLLPDWRGNQRLDSLRNIVRDPRMSLMFLVPGSANVVRVNGTSRLTTDPGLVARFEDRGRRPTLVVVVTIGEIYSQCARAILRADLWSGRLAPDLPSVGALLAEAKAGFDGAAYDAEWPERAARTMW